MKFGFRKLESWGAPEDEQIMTLSSFWHNTGSWQTDGQTDRQTDTLRSLLPVLAVASRG